MNGKSALRKNPVRFLKGLLRADVVPDAGDRPGVKRNNSGMYYYGSIMRGCKIGSRSLGRVGFVFLALVALCGCTTRDRERISSKTPPVGVLISASLEGGDSTNIAFGLSVKSLEKTNFEVMIDSLPDVHSSRITLALVAPEFGNYVLERVGTGPYFPQHSIVGVQTIRPNEKFQVSLPIAAEFPDFPLLNGKVDLLLFWSYQLDVVIEHKIIPCRSDGCLRLPKSGKQ